MSVLCFCACGFIMFTFSKWWSYLFWFMVKQMHWCRVHNANKHLFVWTTYRWESKLNIGFYLLKYWVENIAGNIGNWEFLKKPISCFKIVFRLFFPCFLFNLNFDLLRWHFVLNWSLFVWRRFFWNIETFFKSKKVCKLETYSQSSNKIWL